MAMLDLSQIWTKEISNRSLKEDIARQVAGRAKAGELIGVGSGSTSYLTILALGERVRQENLTVWVVPTSIEATLTCMYAGLSVLPNIPRAIDWCFDGADEVDSNNRLIKGRGGAMLKEKINFRAAQQILVVADESKSVNRLGAHFPVPIEVDPLSIPLVYERLLAMEHTTEVIIRQAVKKDGPVLTEKGNVIIDARFSLITDADEQFIMNLPGVYETGIFSGFTFERILNN